MQHMPASTAGQLPPTSQSTSAAARPALRSDRDVDAVPVLSRLLGPADLTRTAYDSGLSEEDIAYFKKNGMLIKKGLLDPTKLKSARDKVWDAIEGTHIA